MLTNIPIPQPPGINALYTRCLIFFAVIPVILASVMLPPQGRYWITSGTVLGHEYVHWVFRVWTVFSVPSTTEGCIEDPAEVSWFTGKVLENKIFHASTGR
jgi:hypothetical protein